MSVGYEFCANKYSACVNENSEFNCVSMAAGNENDVSQSIRISVHSQHDHTKDKYSGSNIPIAAGEDQPRSQEVCSSIGKSLSSNIRTLIILGIEKAPIGEKILALDIYVS